MTIALVKTTPSSSSMRPFLEEKISLRRAFCFGGFSAVAGERCEEGGCEGGECAEGGREVSPRLVLKMSNHSASSCLEEGRV